MGYKLEQFFKKVDENLRCPICHDVFKNPLSCKDGHTFCCECIEKWLKRAKKCPADNRVLKKISLVRNLTVKGIIENMDVYCDLQHTCQTEPGTAKKAKLENSANDEDSDDQRCCWVGNLHELPTHRKTCAFQQEKCPNKNCHQIIIRKQLAKHKETCIYKTVVCKECKHSVMECKLEDHLKNHCPNAMIACPNNCRKDAAVTKIMRSSKNLHIVIFCGMTVIDCPFAGQGCSTKVQRGKVDAHLKENISSHMQLLAKENTQLKRKLAKMEEGIDPCNTYTWNTYTWIITDFKSKSQKHPTGKHFISTTFWLCGHSWHLKLLPNGCKQTNKLLVYLYFDNRDSQTASGTCIVASKKANVSFSISVLSRLPGTKDMAITRPSWMFTPESNAAGGKFMEAQESLSSSYCDPSDGTFTIQCTIKLPN